MYVCCIGHMWRRPKFFFAFVFVVALHDKLLKQSIEAEVIQKTTFHYSGQSVCIHVCMYVCMWFIYEWMWFDVYTWCLPYIWYQVCSINCLYMCFLQVCIWFNFQVCMYAIWCFYMHLVLGFALPHVSLCIFTCTYGIWYFQMMFDIHLVLEFALLHVILYLYRPFLWITL